MQQMQDMVEAMHPRICNNCILSELLHILKHFLFINKHLILYTIFTRLSLMPSLRSLPQEMTKNCLFERLNLFLICISACFLAIFDCVFLQSNTITFQYLSVYPVNYLGTRNYVHYEPALLRHSCCFGVAIVTGVDSNSTLINEASTPSDGLIKILSKPGWI